MPRHKLHKLLSERDLATFERLAALRLSLGDIAAILSQQTAIEVTEANLRWHIAHSKLIGKLYRLGRAKASLSLAQSAYSLAVESGTVSGLQYFERSRGLLNDLPNQDGSNIANQSTEDPFPVQIVIPDNGRGDCTIPMSSENKLEGLFGDDLDEG
jgi:hypothetical protein